MIEKILTHPLIKQAFSFYRRYGYFFMINVGGFGINLGLTSFFTEIVGLFYIGSYVIGTLANWTFNFFLNSKITFRGHDEKDPWKRYIRFLWLYTKIAVLNFVTVYLLTSILGLHYLLSISAVTFVYSLLTYAALKKKIFVPKSDSPTPLP